MNTKVSTLVVDQFTRSLKALKTILIKAEDFAQQRKFNPDLYLDLRLAPDMFPFVKQVQIASDTAKASLHRLTGKPVPTFSDSEKTLRELMDRVDKTLQLMHEFEDSHFHDYATQTVTFSWLPGKHLVGDDYLTSFAIPNFYFHVSCAYAILRGSGVPLGKADFLGELNWRDTHGN